MDDDNKIVLMICCAVVALVFLFTNCVKDQEIELTKRQFIAGTNVIQNYALPAP